MVTGGNMVVFMSDNHSSRFLGCYGHPTVRTPNLDAIARQGVRFDTAYCASPLCCPARAAIATGRFPHQTGYWDNAIAYDGRIPSWMHRLTEADCMVVAVGKLHFRAQDSGGFSDELIPMHILNGKGAVKNLMRGYQRGELDALGDERWELYFAKNPAGEAEYLKYDQAITQHAIKWLKEVAPHLTQRWVLVVSYASPHPPLLAPRRLLDLYPPDAMALPQQFAPGDRPMHPAAQYHRRKFGTWEMNDERALRRMIAGYCALITHVDEQVGEVMETIGGLPGPDPRVLYTSDHGEMLGAHGLLGKSVLYEEAIRVPLLMAGPDVPQGRTVGDCVSHVDLFPTILESCAVAVDAADRDLPGRSLWQAINGRDRNRTMFAEYHANFSKSGSFMLRDGALKLIYHVGMPAQLFNLEDDPRELVDLAAGAGDTSNKVAELERKLRQICNPEEVDSLAKSDQRRLAERYGGEEKIAGFTSIAATPPPGVG